MESPPLVWKDRFVVRSYEIDANHRAKVQTLTNYVQEIAIQHAVALGIAKEHLPENRSWMLSRLTLEIDRWPRWGDAIEVETWPSDIDRMLAYRDYLFTNEAGERIAAGTSSWFIVDLAKRRMVRHPETFRQFSLPERPRALPAESLSKLPMAEDAGRRKEFNVRWGETDVNGHANQSAYIDWAMEALPREVRESWEPRSLEIAFRQECRHGERVASFCATLDDGVFLHQLKREDDGAELARLRTRWANHIPRSAPEKRRPA